MQLRYQTVTALAIAIATQSASAKADELSPLWADLYQSCTDNTADLGSINSAMRAAGWKAENWPEHALDTARLGGAIAFFPPFAKGKQDVIPVIAGLDQLRSSEALPADGLALSDPQTNDRAYVYENEGNRHCRFVSRRRQIGAVFVAMKNDAPPVWGLKQSGIQRTESLYAMVDELTLDADPLMPADFPYRFDFFVSLDLQQSENTP